MAFWRRRNHESSIGRDDPEHETADPNRRLGDRDRVRDGNRTRPDPVGDERSGSERDPDYGGDDIDDVPYERNREPRY